MNVTEKEKQFTNNKTMRNFFILAKSVFRFAVTTTEVAAPVVAERALLN